MLHVAPLHKYIQGFIDRRCYRRKYDAQKTLTAFSASLRSSNNADLEHLKGELVRVIEETLQPAHLSLWLRSEAVSPSEEPGHREERKARDLRNALQQGH